MGGVRREGGGAFVRYVQAVIWVVLNFLDGWLEYCEPERDILPGRRQTRVFQELKSCVYWKAWRVCLD